MESARHPGAGARPRRRRLPPGSALFVADPSLNGVMVYDEQSTGTNITPYGILAGPNTQLNGPVAVAYGKDVPCDAGGPCQSYLWVSNAGEDTITCYTLPLTAWNQAPVATISWNATGSCGPGISAPYGIVHVNSPDGTNPGEILETSEANDAGYYIVGFPGNGGPSIPCNTSYSNGLFSGPSGPSLYLQSSPYFPDVIFNANSRTVTATGYGVPNTWSNTIGKMRSGGARLQRSRIALRRRPLRSASTPGPRFRTRASHRSLRTISASTSRTRQTVR